jgi:hypothetical protein
VGIAVKIPDIVRECCRIWHGLSRPSSDTAIGHSLATLHRFSEALRDAAANYQGQHAKLLRRLITRVTAYSDDILYDIERIHNKLTRRRFLFFLALISGVAGSGRRLRRRQQMLEDCQKCLVVLTEILN